MRPCKNLLASPLPIYDLPVLPFLAPRIFTQWPANPKSRRVHSTSQETLKHANGASGHGRLISGVGNAVGIGSCKIHSTSTGSRETLDNSILQAAAYRKSHPRKTLFATPRKPALGNYYDHNPTKDKYNSIHNNIWGPIILPQKRPTEQLRDQHRRKSRFASNTDINQGVYSKMGSLGHENNKNPVSGKFQGVYNNIWGQIKETKNLSEEMQSTVRTKKTSGGKQSKVQFRQRARENGFVSIEKSGPLKRRIPRSIPQSRSPWLRQRRLLMHRRSQILAIKKAFPDPISGNVRVYLSQDPKPVKSSRAWCVGFADLWWNFNPRHLPSPFLRNDKDIELFQTLEDLLSKASYETFIQTWGGIDVSERVELWPKLMLAFLHKDPTLALKFLVSTCTQPLPPGYAITDSLKYLFNRFLRDRNSARIFFRPLFLAVLRLYEATGIGYFHLSQDTIYLLFRHLEPDELERFYAILIQNKNFLNDGMLIDMVHVFTRRGLPNMAVDALRRLYEAEADFTEPRIENACAALLQRKFRGNSGPIMPDSELFAFMLNLGLQPSIKFYNILLRNSLQTGDPETAWRIHDMMLDNGIEPDAYTYSHLLYDAKLRMDRSKVEDILCVVESKGIRDPHIITDLLHAIFLSPEQEQGEIPSHLEREAFERMFELYCRFFEMGPLAHLIPSSDRILSVPPTTHMEKVYPSSITLLLMIMSYLRGFRSDHLVLKWYKSFRELVVQGHPDIVPLVSASHIYDAVIKCLGRFPQRLGRCVEIIGDMAASFEESRRSGPANNTNISTGRTTRRSTIGGIIVKPVDKISQGPWSYSENRAPQAPVPSMSKPSLGHCAPSAWTWTILLKAYMDHGKPQAAEKVLATMRNQGITPTHVTWSCLAIGYGRMQDIHNTIDTIERYENEGYMTNEVMIRGLQAIRNRRALIQALERSQEKKARVHGDHSLLEEASWAKPQSEESFLRLVLAEQDKAIKKFNGLDFVTDGGPKTGSRWMDGAPHTKGWED